MTRRRYWRLAPTARTNIALLISGTASRQTSPRGFVFCGLALIRDDGVAVYLNGRELARDNLAAGATHETYALSAIADMAESTSMGHLVSPGQLREGPNTLAVEVHQAAPDSTDISLDLQLGSPRHAAMVFEDLLATSHGRSPAVPRSYGRRSP